MKVQITSRWHNSAKLTYTPEHPEDSVEVRISLETAFIFRFLTFPSLINFFTNHLHINLQLRGMQPKTFPFVHSAPDTLVSMLLLASMPQRQRLVAAFLSAVNAVFPHVDMVCFFTFYRSLLKYCLIREVFHDHPISLAPLRTYKIFPPYHLVLPSIHLLSDIF